MNKLDINDAIEREDEHHIERHNHFMEVKKTKKIDLLFVGDSITRRWLESPQMWNYFFARHNPENFGVGSDTIQNLKWRLLNGEIDDLNPKIVVLLIGTNNLPEYTDDEICEGISGIVEILKNSIPDTKIILMGLLPRAADDKCDNYIKTIQQINKKLLRLSKDKNLMFLDIGEGYMDSNNSVKRDLMPDGIHLIEPGYKIWGEIIQPIIDKNI
ncbi:UNVERIFIED_CONTAM: beta-glucosidase [Acetivibrio alkalicellulosi]